MATHPVSGVLHKVSGVRPFDCGLRVLCFVFSVWCLVFRKSEICNPQLIDSAFRIPTYEFEKP
jgi:hypothetical protein